MSINYNIINIYPNKIKRGRLMKKSRLFVNFIKIKRDSLFVHFVANLIIIAVLLTFFLGSVIAPVAITASAPIYRGNAEEKKVSLMINVYWGEAQLPEILEILDAYNVTCTFFVGGCWAAKNLNLLKQIAEKHEIGNHGYLHKDCKKLSQQQITDEILVCEKLVEQATGKKTRLFAPPSGSLGDNLFVVAKKLDYKVIMWSKDTIDWRDNDYKVIYQRATSQVQNGELILMHPMQHTVKALPLILEFYKQNGYKVVSVSENITGDIQ